MIGTRDLGYANSLFAEISTPNMTIAIIEAADQGINHANGVEASVGLVHHAIDKLSNWLDATD